MRQVTEFLEALATIYVKGLAQHLTHNHFLINNNEDDYDDDNNDDNNNNN